MDETTRNDEVPQDPDPKSSRGWRLAAVASGIAAVGMLGVLGSLLFGGSADDSEGGDVLACVPSRDFTKDADPSEGDACPPKGAEFVDGLVQKADEGEFELRPIDRGSSGALTLFVREPDRAYIDVQHAQTHAALGQPVRVFTKEHEGRQIVIYMEDTPLMK